MGKSIDIATQKDFRGEKKAYGGNGILHDGVGVVQMDEEALERRVRVGGVPGDECCCGGDQRGRGGGWSGIWKLVRGSSGR